VNALTGSILVSWESFAMSSGETQYRAWDPTTLMVHCRWLPDYLVFEGKEKARKAVAEILVRTFRKYGNIVRPPAAWSMGPLPTLI
jgi:hypothetical protein